MESPSQPRERRYISNPNHVDNMGPSTQQPAPQQPRFDPFPRRDPFLPATQGDKKDSSATSPYWSPSNTQTPTSRPADFQHKDILQPAPQPPPSPFGTSAFGHDHARRSSIGGEGHTASNAPTPQVSSFLNRHMPPPASSPNHSPPNPLGRANFPNTSNGASRDGLANSPSSRPSNNMSISSIMGSDSPAAQRGPAWSPVSNRGSGFGAYHPPQSPHRNGSSASGSDDKRPVSQQYGPYLHASPTSASANPLPPSSPDRNTHTSPIGLSTFQSSSNASILPPRPYSQPAPSDVQHRQPPDPSANGDRLGQAGDRIDFPGRRTASDEYGRGPLADATSRDRAYSDGRPMYGPHLRRADLDPPEQPSTRSGPVSPRQHWRTLNPGSDVRDPDRPIASREGPQLPPSSLDELRPFGPVYGPLTSQADHHLGSTIFPTSNAQPVSEPPIGDRRQDPNRSTPSSFTDSFPRPPYLDAHLRRSLEASQMAHRSILGASQDAYRRIDRGSPLPQAVQGASSQPVGSGRDPSIKSEFGRMFSGLGSGVGSTPVPMPPNGSPTPAKQRANSDDVEMNGSFSRHNGDRPGESQRGAKRSRDQDGRMGSESGDGRATPTLSGKRSKHSQPGHHHHHHHAHPVSHHHHHYRANQEDDANAPVLARTASGTPFSTLKFGSTVRTPGAVTTPGASAAIGVPRHHHHGHHHHHAAPARTPAPMQPFRRPVTTIKTQPLLQSLAHLPRKHLGNQLYAPRIAMPSSLSTPLYTKHPYATVPNPLPDFQGKANCTFTLRVPRFYLTDTIREHICQERKVWGTDVYTDDSDVLAAAIHSGWVRGAWGDDVDISMLELEHPKSAPAGKDGGASTGTGQDAATNAGPPGIPTTDQPASDKTHAATDTLTEPPATGPVAPPADRDAHITVLILPPLELYAPSTWHGIRSRKWGDNHDGMSFKIERVEWVDEGAATRFQERRRPGTIKKAKTLSTQQSPSVRVGA